MEKHNDPHPPKLVITLLHLICNPDYAEEIEGDVRERFHRDMLKHGYRAARKNVWRQLLLLVRPNLMFHLTNNPMKSYLNPKANPHGLLVPVALVLFALVAGVSAFGFDFAEKQLFALPLSTVVWVIPSLLLMYWFVYLGASRILYSRQLSLVHTVTTVAVALALVTLSFFAARPATAAVVNHEFVGNSIQVLVVLFALAQLVFVSNVLGGMIRRIGLRQGD